MNIKENDEFSETLLLLCVVAYLLITAVAFGGVVSLSESAGAAIIDFLRDFGAILAGMPVLLGVLVAKRQLDANRRQHVANVKRSFRSELDALNALQRFADQVLKFDVAQAQVVAALLGSRRLAFSIPEASKFDRWREILPDRLMGIADSTRYFVEAATSAKKHDKIFRADIESARSEARALLDEIDLHLEHLSEYWN